MKTKKEIKNQKEEQEEANDFTKKVITALIVLVIFFLFYILTLYITSKHSEDTSADNYNEETTEAQTSYDNIMLGRSLSMSDGDYLVLCYDKSLADDPYSNMVSSYSSKEGALEVYTVDLSSSFNKGYVTDGESNPTPQDSSSFAINGPTLFKVSNHSVVEYVEGEEAISSYLGE